MMCRRRVRAASLIAAAFTVCQLCLPVASSQADDDEPHTIFFNGRDIWRNGAFAYTGLLFAPGGFEDDGFMLKLLTSGGVYRYYAGSLGGERVVGAEWLLQAMPGFRIKRGQAEIKFFFGPEWQVHRLWPDDPGNNLRGRTLGLRMSGELWYEPSPLTLITGDASLSSIAASPSARLAFGMRVADDILNGDGFYIGPETQYFGSDGYAQWRIGGHITSLKTDATEWSAGFGWAQDTDGRSSPYLRLNVSTKISD
ncbi:MAG: cellulose biosynthesis protein BcsS [Rhodopseudomonas sp.]|nr:cellulose biosynthesis protein BcsS [Rhodopseudomonas sp.]